MTYIYIHIEDMICFSFSIYIYIITLFHAIHIYSPKLFAPGFSSAPPKPAAAPVWQPRSFIWKQLKTLVG